MKRDVAFDRLQYCSQMQPIWVNRAATVCSACGCNMVDQNFQGQNKWWGEDISPPYCLSNTLPHVWTSSCTSENRREVVNLHKPFQNKKTHFLELYFNNLQHLWWCVLVAPTLMKAHNASFRSWTAWNNFLKDEVNKIFILKKAEKVVSAICLMDLDYYSLPPQL